VDIFSYARTSLLVIALFGAMHTPGLLLERPSRDEVVKEFSMMLVCSNGLRPDNKAKEPWTNFLPYPSLSLKGTYNEIDTQDVSQFPPKDQIIASLKEGPCSGIFKEYYSSPTYDRLYEGTTSRIIYSPLRIASQPPPPVYALLESFLNNYDGLIYFFYSLSQIENPKNWLLAITTLVLSTDTDNPISDRTRSILVKGPYSIHQYFVGMSALLKNMDQLPGSTPHLLRTIHLLINMFTSFEEVVSTFNSLLTDDDFMAFCHFFIRLRNNPLNNNHRATFQRGENNLKGINMEEILDIFYISKKEGIPQGVDGNLLFPLWLKVLEREQTDPGAVKLKEFIIKNQQLLFRIYDNYIHPEALGLLAHCQIPSREKASEALKVKQVLPQIPWHNGDTQRCLLDTLSKMPDITHCQLFSQFCAQNNEILESCSNFWSLCSFINIPSQQVAAEHVTKFLLLPHVFQNFSSDVSDITPKCLQLYCQNTSYLAPLEQALALVDRHFPEFFEEHDFCSFLSYHSTKVDPIHWQTISALYEEFEDTFDAFGLYYLGGFPYLSTIIKEPARWQKALQLARTYAESFNQDSDDNHNCEDFQTFLRMLAGSPFEQWNEVAEKAVTASSIG